MAPDSSSAPALETCLQSTSRVLQNWNGVITYQATVVSVCSVEDVQTVVRDRITYPSPVRAKGSHHSMSDCIVNDGGTVLDMRAFDTIEVDVENKTVTVGAGVELLEAAKVLASHGLQFYVNIELGAMTLGSGACCGTKDASYYSRRERKYEYGQVSSYAVGFKLVDGHGEIVEVSTSRNAELLPALRSSYGLLGIVCEVTFQVKELTPVHFEHIEYSLDEFTKDVDTFFDSQHSNMLYLFPFLDKVVVERRAFGSGKIGHGSRQWKWRNFARKSFPALARLTRRLPEPFEFIAIDAYCLLIIKFLVWVVRGRNSSVVDQIIDYPKKPGSQAYAFSIWAFEHQHFARIVREYFAFCREYYRLTGFRCDLPSVGYGVREDQSALFSYSRRGNAFTLDPISTGGEAWERFLHAYNEFCERNGGRPLLNQTRSLLSSQFRASFTLEIPSFIRTRRRFDPHDRFYNRFFRELLAQS